VISTRTNANYRGNVPFALMCAIIFDLDCPVFQPGCVAIMLRNFLSTISNDTFVFFMAGHRH
jgi:hypothetical protein